MLMVLEFKNDMKITQKYVRSTARSAIHWLFDISAKALEIWAVKSPKCIVRCAVDCTYGQQHDRLIITVKYCQSNIYGEVNRVKKYWWCLTILYSLTWCWLYLRVNHCTERKSYTHSHQVTNININIKNLRWGQHWSILTFGDITSQEFYMKDISSMGFPQHGEVFYFYGQALHTTHALYPKG
jgi:hypothetical protein